MHACQALFESIRRLRKPDLDDWLLESRSQGFMPWLVSREGLPTRVCKPSFDTESSFDPEVSGPKGRTKCKGLPTRSTTKTLWAKAQMSGGSFSHSHDLKVVAIDL